MRLLLPFFPLLLPLAVQWAERHERTILRDGRPLDDAHISDAAAMGVAFPERIRLLQVPQIPLPVSLPLSWGAEAVGFVSDNIAGMALGYGIFLQEEWAHTRHIIAHECVHTAQYERLGGIRPFLARYLRECIEFGYANSPLEQEAMRKSANMFG